MCASVGEVLESPYFWFCLRYGLSTRIFAFCSRFSSFAIDLDSTMGNRGSGGWGGSLSVGGGIVDMDWLCPYF